MATKAFQKIYTKITQITKATCSLKATGVGYDELATVNGKLAQVVKIAGDDVTLQVFEGTEGIPTNAEVVFLGKSPTLKVSEQLAGRFFNAFGDPIDGGPEIEGQEVEIGGPSVNPVRRKQPSELIATGIAGIDLNNTLVSGQKIPFFADPDQPYNAVMANVALLANLFFTLGILASFQSALTMPGIAGIVLTLGTAVDANVLIYERIKEEMRGGKGIKEALEAGYKNAFSAIFDSNLTSLITGIILLVTGTGPIRGFATTWIIGLCCSFFTAVFLTRIVYEKQMAKNRWLNQKFYTSISKNLMQNVNFGFMKMSKKSFTLCGIAAVVFIGSFAIRGLSQSIDFTGGRNYVVTLNKATEVESVRELLDGAFVNTTGTDAGKQATTSVIALGTDGKTIRVSTNYNIESNDPMEDDRAETILYNALHKAGFVSQANVEAFKNPDIRTGGSIISSAKVGPSVAKDITYGAIISVALALFFIFLYILLRFRNLGFSFGSIVALFFDTLTVVGIYSLCWGWMPFSLEIDQTFIGAILTVIGYSINDKVVVFDRIRENLKLHPKQDRETLFNSSINQTLARTINTSASTLIVLLCIFFLGGESIRSFSFAMILGVVFGTLSSIFIASPMAYMVLKRKTIDTNEVAKA